jgi:hypothetical protein
LCDGMHITRRFVRWVGIGYERSDVSDLPHKG